MMHVDRLMHQALSDRVFPGGVLLVSRDNQIEFFEAYGCTDLFSGALAARDTVYDLASLTKPLATTLAVMQLIQESRLSLDQPVVSILPCFLDPLMSRVTIRHLLAHSSGIADYHPYYVNLRQIPVKERKERLEKMLIAERLVGFPGKQVIYSDIGFMMLRWIIETVSGQRLDHFLSEFLYHPLGLQRIYFMDLKRQTSHEDIAATELCMWRHSLIKGKVHDDNAFVMGGIDGHAGLFGSAADIACLISVLMSDYRKQSRGAFFDSKLIQVFWSRQMPSGRALGFDMPSTDIASSGRFFSYNSIGHLGFTGTSFWIDPEKSIFIILLTNRVHPSRYNAGIRQFRPHIHDAIMARMGLSH